MSKVEWIKITPDIFNDEKILLIEQMPKGDTIIVIWFKLLCLAGRENNNGIFLMNNRVPYTAKMLSTIFKRKASVVQTALDTFEEFGMIEMVDGAITIPNWEKYQNVEGMEKIRADNRERKRRQRERQKQSLTEVAEMEDVSRDMPREVTQQNKKEEKEIENNNINYQLVTDMYNSICVTLPKVKTISDARKRVIKARLSKYSIDDLRTVFEKAEASDFLKGSSGWTANFDWLMKEANMIKVLEDNYKNKTAQKKNGISNFKGRDYEMDSLSRMLIERDAM